MIPAAAIQRGSQGTFVYVVKADQTVKLRPVKLGPVDGERQAIAEGVAPGDLVVSDGVDRLREGAMVEVTDVAPRVQAAGRRQRARARACGASRARRAPDARAEEVAP